MEYLAWPDPREKPTPENRDQALGHRDKAAQSLALKMKMNLDKMPSRMYS